MQYIRRVSVPTVLSVATSAPSCGRWCRLKPEALRFRPPNLRREERVVSGGVGVACGYPQRVVGEGQLGRCDGKGWSADDPRLYGR